MNNTNTKGDTMAQKQDYVRFFDTDLEAETHMRMLNRATGRQTMLVLVDGPEDNFAVMDIDSAIENDFLYRWAGLKQENGMAVENPMHLSEGRRMTIQDGIKDFDKEEIRK